ncbi:MAG: hypothetical protein M5U12_32680 [Verrucomicrobia bacterium]|nr:hypothetical protein [Verrucomicrobiota bacterium]
MDLLLDAFGDGFSQIGGREVATHLELDDDIVRAGRLIHVPTEVNAGDPADAHAAQGHGRPHREAIGVLAQIGFHHVHSLEIPRGAKGE